MDGEIYEIELDDGKYTVRVSDDMKTFECRRHGKPWRDLTGDNMVLALVERIRFLEEALGQK